MQKIIADQITQFLADFGVDCVYLYPGGTIAPLVNSFIALGVKIEVFKHEQGAVYAALAKARLTGKLQVAMVTSGPGVTNAITPLADAFYDSTPLLLITGQIGTGDLLSGRKVRQRGFQEVPTLSIVSEISKLALCPNNVNDVMPNLHDLIHTALDGRKGPVVFDLPMDIQRSVAPIDAISLIPFPNSKAFISNHNDIQSISKSMTQSKRPMMLLGQGALQSGAFEAYRKLCNDFEILVVSSLPGLGSFDGLDEKFLGYIGHTGHEVANLAVHESDFLLVLGARLDVRQTGNVTDKFVPTGKVAWINNDESELLAPRVRVDWKINLDIGLFVDTLIPYLNKQNISRDKEWISHKIEVRKNQTDDNYPKNNTSCIYPKEILQKINKFMRKNKGVVVTGVGSHQQWAARHLAYGPDTWAFLTSAGHGAMGYDIPTAIGAAMTIPEDHIVLCVVGDGSILMNIQELASLAERKLNVKILLLNNRRLGIVSQFQRITWGNDDGAGEFKSPDFVVIANGFGIPARRILQPSEINDGVEWLWSSPGPALLEVHIDHNADVVPMLLGGQMMNEMWQGGINGL